MLINRINKKLLLSAILVAAIPVSFSTSVLAQATVDQVTQEGEKRAARQCDRGWTEAHEFESGNEVVVPAA